MSICSYHYSNKLQCFPLALLHQFGLVQTNLSPSGFEEHGTCDCHRRMHTVAPLIFSGGLDRDGCFSGSVAVDVGGTGLPVIFYTGVQLFGKAEDVPEELKDQVRMSFNDGLWFIEHQLCAVASDGSEPAPPADMPLHDVALSCRTQPLCGCCTNF